MLGLFLLKGTRLHTFVPHVGQPLILACAIVLTACASGPALEQRESYPGIRGDLVRYTWSVLGTPYAWGGADPTGFDCSGLVYYIYGRAGFQVPRTTEEQLAVSTPLDVRQLQPGDLLFFDTGFWQTHVGIYLGNGKFVHAPGSGETVTIASLENAYWRQALIRGGSFLDK